MRLFFSGLLRRSCVLAAGLLPSMIFVGCDAWTSDDPDALRVATTWTSSERQVVASEYSSWTRRNGVRSTIMWSTPDDPVRTPDVLLGGPISQYEALAAKGGLEPLDGATGGRAWITARRSLVGMVPPGSASAAGRATAMADPRVDPTTLAWEIGRLRADGWPVAYAKLVALYGEASPVGWRSGSARAAVVRGEARSTIAPIESGPGEAASGAPFVFEEGGAIPRGARRKEAASRFLQFLSKHPGPVTGPSTATNPALSFDAEELAADLLGATLVDAQDELHAATEAIRAAGSPPNAVELLAQLPPWPPASVEKLLRRETEGAATMVETLAAELAPEPGPRLWLARSWLRPRAAIDGKLLGELARAEEGRLAREPRFRGWLRAEWTQWARQRYRWIARLAASRSPILASNRSSEP